MNMLLFIAIYIHVQRKLMAELRGELKKVQAQGSTASKRESEIIAQISELERIMICKDEPTSEEGQS